MTTPGPVTQEEYRQFQVAYQEWNRKKGKVFFIPECELIIIEDAIAVEPEVE